MELPNITSRNRSNVGSNKASTSRPVNMSPSKPTSATSIRTNPTGPINTTRGTTNTINTSNTTRGTSNTINTSRTRTNRPEIVINDVEEEDDIDKMLKGEMILPEYDIATSFSTLESPETIIQMSVCEITKKDPTGQGSLGDPRMGAIEDDKVCETCRRNNIECPGHFGYIRLAYPIYHPKYGKTIASVLNSICITCSKPYVSREEIENTQVMKMTGANRLKALENLSKDRACGTKCEITSDKPTNKVCGKNPLFGWNNDLFQIKFKIHKKGCERPSTSPYPYPFQDEEAKIRSGKYDKKETFTANIEEIYQILKNISVNDAEFLGFRRDLLPHYMILTVLPVLPPIVRMPNVVNGKILPGKFTRKYETLISTNNNLKKSINQVRTDPSLAKNISEYIQKLNTQIADFINVEIKDVLQGKEGLIRKSMMAKRVNWSGRTVIGPDPSLKFGQIRIPQIMAPYLTKVVSVFGANQKELQKLFDSGKVTHIYPAKGKMAGYRIELSELWSKYQLQIGDRVERWLQNGDYVMLNRQPTLHKQSMMGYEVVLGKQMTIGLHLAYTKPHNADFDGDYKNM